MMMSITKMNWSSKNSLKMKMDQMKDVTTK